MASRSLKNRQNIKKKSAMSGVLIVITVLVAVILAGVGGVAAVASSWLDELPEYKEADSFNTAEKSRIYANDGVTLLAELFLEDREPLDTLDEVSAYVRAGTVATEDERFYTHDGVDMMGIARALFVNLSGGELEGASTITQQFVRNTILSKEATEISVKRKVREAYLSIKLEEEFSKDDILLMYLNTINYGQGAYGIESASKRYFSKTATDLTLVEAATLIGIPQSPTYNNPVDYPDKCLERRNLVLDRMLTNGYISQEEHDEAAVEDLILNETKPSVDGIQKYPYFTDYVKTWLQKEYSQEKVFQGGLKVVTTIDPTLQQYAETAAANKRDRLGDSDLDVGMTVIEPDTGYIVAMVGGKDFSSGQWNVATAGHQPGSTFKTFTLVAALEYGISPFSSISCSRSVSLPDGNKTWNVRNYNGAEYGTRTVAGAFAVSSNTAFARLIMEVGADNVVDVAKRMGITSPLKEVPAITLGTEDVSTTEMAAAYATIANGGTNRGSIAVKEIYDRNNTLIYESDTKGTRALSPEIAYAATEVMKGVITSGTATDASLSSGQPVAGKTGTTDDYKDKWFCGFTPQLSTAIWVGGSPDRKVMPSSISCNDVFREFMNAALQGEPIRDFPVADSPDYSSNKNIGGGSSSNDSKDSDDTKNTEPDENNSGNEGNGGSTTPTPTPDPEPKPTPDPEPKPTPDPDPDPVTPDPPDPVTPDPESNTTNSPASNLVALLPNLWHMISNNGIELPTISYSWKPVVYFN